MRIIHGMLILLLCSALRAESSADGRLVKTVSYQGVIFTPQMIHGSSALWAYPTEDEKRATFWMPSATLIAKAESKLSSRLEEIRSTNPSEGFHFGDYYTPKNSSRDRKASPPAYAYTSECYSLEEWMDELRSSHQRQYIGITADGQKALLMNFLSTPSSTTWKSTWRIQWPYFYYLIGKDEFTPALFYGEVEDD